MFYARFYSFNAYSFDARTMKQIKKSLKDNGFSTKNDEYGYVHILNNKKEDVGLIEKT
jgi:hypothetical protein